jgi:hypothetical protein
MRTTLLAALLSLHLAALATAQPALAAPAAAAEVELQVMPTAGQHQRQTLDMRMSLTLQVTPREDATDDEKARITASADARKMPMTMSSRTVQEVRTGEPDAQGWLPVTMRTQQSAMQMRNAAGELIPMPPSPMADMGLTARYLPAEKRFDVLQLQGKEVDAPMKRMGESLINSLMSSMKPIDGQRFRIGERREFPIEVPMQLPAQLPLNGKMQATAGYTLTRLAQGVAHFDIDMKLALQIAGEVPATPASGATAARPGGPMEVDAGGSGNGTLALRLADRTPLKSTMEMKQSMRFLMPDGNRMNMTMDMTMTSVGENLALPGKANANAKPQSQPQPQLKPKPTPKPTPKP